MKKLSEIECLASPCEFPGPTSSRSVLRTLLALALCVLFLGRQPAAQASESEDSAETPTNRMIHAQGTRIVDAQGDPVHLRGVLLEGWLMWNGTLWGAGLSSETKLADRLEKLVGKEEAARFRTAVYDTFITERDIEMIAELGLNTVRVPLNHTVLEETGREIDYSTPGWSYLDRLLEWCERHAVYVVIGLHSVPGGQSGIFVSDPDRQHVWKSEENLERTVEIWKAIAKRYRDRDIVAGYDLINEPEPPTGADLVALQRRIIEAIRTVDPHHLIFLAGSPPFSSDFSIFPGPLDSNQAYSFHTYNLFSNALGEADFQKLVSIAAAHDVPLWNGEFGAHTPDWVRSQIELFENPAHHVNGWTFWPWKRVPEDSWARNRFRHLMEISSTKDWDIVRKYLASIFGAKKIEPEVARRALSDFIEAMKAENLVAEEVMVEVLQSWRARPAEVGAADSSEASDASPR